MNAKGRLAAALIAVAFFGCHGLPQTATASALESANDDAPEKADKVYITDPSLNGMNALEVTIPAKWHFDSAMYPMGEGITYQGDSCPSMPAGVYRATSPEGLSFVEQMPALVWKWASGPEASSYDLTSCSSLRGEMSAQDFLKYLSATLGVEYVGEEPVPAVQQAKAEKRVNETNAFYKQHNRSGELPSATSTVVLARAIVRYRNGTFAMKGRLSVTMDCLQIAKRFQPTVENTCTATVIYLVAPEGQYAGLVEQSDRNGMGVRMLQPWTQAWMRTSEAETTEMNVFEHEREEIWYHRLQLARDVRRKMLEHFDETVQQGLDKALARSAEMANQNHTIAPDWVDYVLAEDSLRGPASQQFNQPSSSYNIWVESSGKMRYQTYDMKSNPNGILPGNWTKKQAAHADGAN